MKKSYLFLLLFLLTATMTWADTQQKLIVWMKNGQKVEFNLAEEPETTFEDGKLVIKTTKTTVYYLLENVLRYTYDGDITDVVGPKLRPNEIRFMQSTDQMAFDGLADGTQLEIYSLDGMKLGTMQAKGGVRTTVSFSNRPAGTYIVKVGDATYKFLKR
ncbi:MAG: T9SS type A sorting domain-containing protein [Bacteroidaceae bacterium]|nr:T9SS type A sorting domain-containing protein [Bacteroidaceae bacterium]